MSSIADVVQQIYRGELFPPLCQADRLYAYRHTAWLGGHRFEATGQHANPMGTLHSGMWPAPPVPV